jgi:phage-related protein (TIGR01555 family)
MKKTAPKPKDKNDINVPFNSASMENSAIMDSMYNVISSLGIGNYAKTPSTRFKDPIILSWREWETLYAGNGMARRIIDTFAEEMTREWLVLQGDDIDQNLDRYLRLLDTQNKFADLTRWAYLFGGSIIIMIINDGRELNEPVDLLNIKSIEQLRIVDLGQIFLYPEDYYSDPSDAKFNEPQWYTIRPIFYGVPSDKLMFKVHETRVLKIDGAPSTQWLKRLNKGWMCPVLQSYFWDIINLEQSYSYAAEAIHEFILSVYKIKGLSNQMATQNGEAVVKQRLDIINYAKSVINSVVIDADGEDFNKVTSNLSQLDMLLEKQERKVSAMSGIPHSVLFGEQRNGIVSGENADVSSWYDTVRQRQNKQFLPLLKKLLTYISLASDCEFSGDVTNVVPSFNPLWQIDDKDLVEMQLKTAQIDAAYIDRGVYTPEETRKRFIGERFNFDLQLTPEVSIDHQQQTIEKIDEVNEDIKISTDMDVSDKLQTS